MCRCCSHCWTVFTWQRARPVPTVYRVPLSSSTTPETLPRNSGRKPRSSPCREQVSVYMYVCVCLSLSSSLSPSLSLTHSIWLSIQLQCSVCLCLCHYSSVIPLPVDYCHQFAQIHADLGHVAGCNTAVCHQYQRGGGPSPSYGLMIHCLYMYMYM